MYIEESVAFQMSKKAFLDKKITYDDSVRTLRENSTTDDISCIFSKLNCETSAGSCGGTRYLIGGEYMQELVKIRSGFSGKLQTNK